MVNDVVITAGANTVTLNDPFKYEFDHESHMGEVPIPNREGGQVQYLGSRQPYLVITGLLRNQTDYNNLNTNLETIRASATDATVTITYNATTITDTRAGGQTLWRIKKFRYWPVKGSTQFWWAYEILFWSKG